MSLSPADQTFLSKVVNDAVDSGFISDQNSNGRGRNMSIGSGGSSCICCLSGGRSEESDVAVVIAIALFAISALVGFFYTARSSRNAVQAQVDLSKARAVTDITVAVHTTLLSQPSAPPMYYPPQEAFLNPFDYGQPQQYAYEAQQGNGLPNQQYVLPDPYWGPLPYYPPQQQPVPPPQLVQPVYYPNYQPEQVAYVRTGRQEVFDQAVILLEGHRNERTFTACAQGVMSIGAALLTVALLITLIFEPEMETVYLGIAGAGVGFTGLVMWLGKHACLINDREQEAARNILQMIRA